jgi:hypothetical protein
MANILKNVRSFMRMHQIIKMMVIMTCFYGLVPVSQAGLITSDSTSHSITIHWTAPGDDGSVGTASQYDIRYSTSNITNANWASATQATGEPTPQIAGSAESFIVTGLNPGTTYYFAIKAADEIPNWSALSNIATGVTAAENIPPSNIANLVTSNPTGSSISLTWTAPGDDSTSGTASQYDIRYSTSPINDANWASATQVSGEPTPLIAGSQQTFAVTGLQSGRTYYFAMKTADEVPNWSGLSNVANGATSDATPPAAINDLHTELNINSSLPNSSVMLLITHEEAVVFKSPDLC